MSTGHLISLPSFLDITRLRTGLSLVWCPKTKEISNISEKQKAGFPVQFTRKHKTEHNSLGTDKSPLDRAKRKKKLNNRWQERSFIWATGFGFVPFDRKETQTDASRWAWNSVNYFLHCPITSEHNSKKEWKNQCWGVHAPRFHTDSKHTGCSGRGRKKWGGKKWMNTPNVARMHPQNKVKHLRKQKYVGRWLQQWRTNEDCG